MTTLKLAEYETPTQVPPIVRAHPLHRNAGDAAKAEQERADLFNLAREIYLRAQLRKRYRRAGSSVI